MQITIENLELSVDSDVLFDEIRDEITTLIEDAVHDAVQEAVMPAAEDAVAEYLRYNFDITDYFDGTNLDVIVDAVNARNGEADESGRVDNVATAFLQALDNPDVTTALRALMTPRTLAEIVDTPQIRDLLMRIVADQLMLGTGYNIVKQLDNGTFRPLNTKQG